jgi:hypothetical protein
MNTEFTAIIQTLVAEQGREALFNAVRCKSILADYTRNEYKKEGRLLLQAIETGVAEAMSRADDIASCKAQAVRKLQDEYFLAENIAADMVDMLALLLTTPKTQTEPATANPKCANCGKELQDEIVFFRGSAMGGEGGMLKSSFKVWVVVTITNMGIKYESILGGDCIIIPYQSIMTIEKTGPLLLRIYFRLQKDVGVEKVSVQFQFSVFQIKKVIQVLKENNMIIQVA